MSYLIREMKNSDWESVSRIYQQGMDTNLATFQTVCPTWEEFDNSHFEKCRYVILQESTIIGWIALSPISNHCGYRGVAEISIYIDANYAGKGLGSQLLTYIIEVSEQLGYWTLQASVMSDNLASIRLHEKCGFRTIGFREKIGKDRYGKWRNVTLMEKRSLQLKYNMEELTDEKSSVCVCT